jgi:hypothetical protein
MTGKKADPALVESLVLEREGYLRYGRTDRARDVEAELKRLGASIPVATKARRPRKAASTE